MNPYVQQMLDTNAAQNGGVVRRMTANVVRFGYYDALLAAVQERGWHLFQYGTQTIVVCSAAPLVMLAP